MPEKSDLELAVDILLVAMQKERFNMGDPDSVVKYLKSIYQGIQAMKER